MKKKLIGALILLFILAVPFRYAFFEPNFEQPMISMIAFIFVVFGGVASMYFILADDKAEEKA